MSSSSSSTKGPSAVPDVRSTWVHRTRSGLPLCPSCGIELGFCEHSPSRFGTRGGKGKNGGKVKSEAVPNALLLDAAEPPDSESNMKETQRQKRGIKRPHDQERRTADAAVRKGKRPALRREAVGGDLPLVNLPVAKGKGKGKAKHLDELTLRRSKRTKTSNHRPFKYLSQAGGGSGTGTDRDRMASTDRDVVLLTFPGFHSIVDRRKCLACLTDVDGITVSFECEERRLYDARAAETTGTGVESKTGQEALMGGKGETQPHLMCLECFRMYVSSRINDRKLLASRDVDGYTVGCPMGCPDSCVDPACFEALLERQQIARYRRFCAIHLASDMRVIWCPACHCGVAPDTAESATEYNPQSNATPSPIDQSGAGSKFASWAWWRRRTGVSGRGDSPASSSVPRNKCIACPGCQAPLCTACRHSHGPDRKCDEVHASTVSEWHCEDDHSEHGDIHESEQPAKESKHEAGKGGKDSLKGGVKEEKRNGARKGPRKRAGNGPRNGSGVSSACMGPNTKGCPNCHAPIFKEGGCNHMTCGMCHFEFCWLHLTKWELGGTCQRGHWSSDSVLNSAYNAQHQAAAAAAGIRDTCVIS